MLFAFPISTDVVNPAVRDAEMLTANLAVRLLLARSLAITQSNVLVYSALKFDPLLYRIRYFAGLIPGDDSRFAIFVGFIKLYIICTCIIRFTFKPSIDIDFSVTLRCFTWQLFATTKLPYDINIDHCRKQAARMARWGIVRSREHAILIFLGDFRQIITRNGFFKKNGKTMSGFLKIRDFF